MTINRRALIAGAVAAPSLPLSNEALWRTDPAYARRLETLARDVVTDAQRLETGLSVAHMSAAGFKPLLNACAWVRNG